jgi:sec-independent protein translocase protein TatC
MVAARQNLGAGQSLIGTGVTEAFFIEIKVALAGEFFFPARLFFTQIWRFISPGLSGNEKRLVLPLFVLCATLFFTGGALFCYHVVLPVAFQYFIEQYGTIDVTPAIRIGRIFHIFFFV